MPQTLNEEIPWLELPGVSIENGLMRVGNNRNLYQKLLSQFRSGNEETVANIRETMTAGDLATAARMAHTVKGVAANLGADTLAGAGAELETAFKQGKLEGVEVLIASFETELGVVMEGIRFFEEARSIPERAVEPTEVSEMNLELVREQASQLAQMLAHGMVDSMEQIEALDNQFFYHELRPHWERLKQQVDMFDLDSALAELQEIANALHITWD